jgi:hypothetical protein
MPVDDYIDEDDEKNEGSSGERNAQSRFAEFECPVCSANNPCDPPIRTGDEPICNYCGTQYLVKVTEAGRLRLREL